jgi:hypothetical protein
MNTLSKLPDCHVLHLWLGRLTQRRIVVEINVLENEGAQHGHQGPDACQDFPDKNPGQLQGSQKCILSIKKPASPGDLGKNRDRKFFIRKLKVIR